MPKTALRSLAPVALLFLALCPAHAATVQEVFKKFDLLGNWSADCTKPVGPQNPYVTHRALGADRMQRGPMFDSTTPPTLFVVDQAAEGKPGELAFSFKDGKNRVNLVVRVEHNRMRTMERALDNGQKPIVNGRQADDGRDTPWFNKCD
jgi:hypothetical protein